MPCDVATVQRSGGRRFRRAGHLPSFQRVAIFDHQIVMVTLLLGVKQHDETALSIIRSRHMS